MNSGQKKGINFDLDTNALKIHYTEGDWRNAYYDVRNFFKKNGLEHIQGSGYFQCVCIQVKIYPFLLPTIHILIPQKPCKQVFFC